MPTKKASPKKEVLVKATKKETSKAIAKAKPAVLKASTKVVSVATNHLISKAEAKAMVQLARKKSKMAAIDFDKAAVLELLNQPGCDGLRIYAAINAAGEKTYVLTGTANKNDLFIKKTNPTLKSAKSTSAEEEFALDLGQVCDPVMQVYGLNVNMLF